MLSSNTECPIESYDLYDVSRTSIMTELEVESFTPTMVTVKVKDAYSTTAASYSFCIKAIAEGGGD